jgi:NADH-quinone oxidoreductase subunit E
MLRNIQPEQKQSAVMASLIAAQTEVGWVSPEVISHRCSNI